MAKLKEHKKPDLLLSVVIVLNNDSGLKINQIKELISIVKQKVKYFEILLLDNSGNDSFVDKVKETKVLTHNVRHLKLSKHYTLEIAVTAALDNSIGDYTVIINLETDPLKILSPLLEKAFQGNDIVIAIPYQKVPRSRIERISIFLLKKISTHALGFEFDPEIPFFSVLSKRAVNSIIQIRRKRRSMVYINNILGFRQTVLRYPNSLKTDRQKLSIFEYIHDCLDVVVSNSQFPLRLATFLGLVASSLSLLFLLYVLIVSFVKQRVIEGWVTTSIVDGSLFLLLFIILSIMSEYIGRILDEIQNQPLYFISEESDSAIFDQDKGKLNIS